MHERDDDLPRIPVLTQLSELYPMTPAMLVEWLHLLGYALSVGLQQLRCNESPSLIGVDLEGGKPVHTEFEPHENRVGRVFVDAADEGRVRAWSRNLPNLAVSADEESVFIEMTRLSDNDREECERLVRAGMRQHP